jgi:hypothetical protein
MGCGASSESANVTYLNGKPTFKGDDVTKGFEKDNGLLFRIVNKKKKQWAYYNDTKQYEMHVCVTFNEDCDIRALGKTHLEQQDNGEWVATVVVYPCETEMFIEGRVNGFRSKMDALPLSDEYRQRQEKKK